MLELTQKWDQKKNSGNIVKKQEEELPTEEEIMKAKQAEAQCNEEEVSVGGNTKGEMKEQGEVATHISASDKKILEEMYELEKKHFGEEKKTVKIDVAL